MSQDQASLEAEQARAIQAEENSKEVEDKQEDGADADEKKKRKKQEKDAEKAAKKEKALKKKAAQEAAAKEQAEKKDDEKKEEKKKGKKKEGDEEKKEVVFVDDTPAGQKKDMTKPMAEAYHPKMVEAAWDSWWENQGFYHADVKSQQEKFVMVIPPPNVTGTLHIGHALTASIEDALTRWHRMNGRVALWIPGTDHAGIATQVVVEKKLKKERGLTRHDLGREEFIKEVWKFKEEHGNIIFKQLRRMGASVDWTRESFTLDEKLSRAVVEAFCRLFEQGLLYRSNRLVNWSCSLRTAISDIEVDSIELTGPKKLKVPGHERMVEFGVIHSFAYKFVDSDDEIIVATTRLETMLGDVAVAVHPDDERYKPFHGRKLKHPFCDREILLVCDKELVDMNFGTGAVKVTPAHDHNDFMCGQRHGLEFINIFTDDGVINQNGAQFAGMMRYDARYAVQQALTELGLFRGVAPNPMRLGVCQRSKDIIEPVLRPQWFVSCKEMARNAVEAVRSGQLEIVPSMHEATWYRWMDNIQDWCVSRQLWWGHQIPAYLVSVNDSQPDGFNTADWVVGRSYDDALARAQAKYPGQEVTLTRDPDVLDTWFSSGLFPFSVFGWPEETDDFRAFYPTSLLETGHDILFFWVARMVFMGQALTGTLPFKRIYLHAMVRDKYGRKMSKSLGNVLDPISVMEGITLAELHETLTKGNLDPSEVDKAKKGQELDFPDGIPECGADALRFGLLAYTSQGQNINLDINRVVAYRQFCNKLWNATRFALLNFDAEFVPPASFEQVGTTGVESFADKWILSRLHLTCQNMQQAFVQFEFAQATQTIYDFWWDLCDYYLELIKPVMFADQAVPENLARRRCAQSILYTCLDHGLRLMHPLMPFVTEELYQRLPGRQAADSIVVAPYPAQPPAHWHNDVMEANMKTVQLIVHATRSARAGLDLDKSARPELFVSCKTPELYQVVHSTASDIATLTWSSSVTALAPDQSPPANTAMSPIDHQSQLYVVLKGLVNYDSQIQKLQKKREKQEQLLVAIRKKMNAPDWSSKTPEEVKQQQREKLEEYATQVTKIDESISLFTEIKAQSGSS